MSIEIKEVITRRQLRKFVLFPELLYKDNPYYVPPIVFDQIDTLNPKKSAAREFCDYKLYLAYKDGKIAGRVAAIVNHKANEQWDHKEVRFGWYDFIEDYDVARALMDKVEEFGRQYGMDSVVGPLGFTDFDPEGLLIEGYDQLSTMALIYNHPYYVDFIENRMGFEKDADWVEFKMYLPDEFPERLDRVKKVIEERYNVHVRPITRKIIKEEDYGHKIFRGINECYKKLYNFTVLPDSMADKYLDFYLSILDLRFISVVENEKGDLVAFGVTMPSIVRALQKCRGKLWPLGWWYLLRSLFWKREEGVEMLLVGVLPEYQNTGINILLHADMFTKFHEFNVKWAETNAILEYNMKNQLQFRYYNPECKKRRRSYIKKLDY